MTITTDQRRVPSEPDPEGLEIARTCAGTVIEAELELAKALARVHRRNAIAEEGCASIQEFGRRCNLTGERTLLLLRAARGMEIDPRIEPGVREGALTMYAAGLIGRLLFRIGGQDPDHDWFAVARGVGARSLTDAVRHRLAEIDQAPKTLTTVTVHVEEEVASRFGQARVLLSRKAGRVLTKEEAFEQTVEHVLDALDPDRSLLGTGTPRIDVEHEETPGRYIPNWVKREHRKLFGGTCCIPGCTNAMFTQEAHRKPYARGGRRGPRDVHPMCTLHHTLYDAGLLRVVDITEEGRPVFETVSGVVLHPDRPVSERPRAPPEPRADSDPSSDGDTTEI